MCHGRSCLWVSVATSLTFHAYHHYGALMSSTALDAVRRELLGDAAVGGTLLPTSSGEEAFAQLLRAIVSLRYEPGQVISERELMSESGSTKAAVRLSVWRLCDLGLMTTLPRKGLLVTPLDVATVSDVYDARETIEVEAARLAAMRATPVDRERLAEMVNVQRAMISSDQALTEVLEHDSAVHLAVAEAARNRYLEHFLIRLLPLSARLWHRLYKDVGPSDRFTYSHVDLADAVASKNPETAASSMRAHLREARRLLTAVFVPARRGDQ